MLAFLVFSLFMRQKPGCRLIRSRVSRQTDKTTPKKELFQTVDKVPMGSVKGLSMGTLSSDLGCLGCLNLLVLNTKCFVFKFEMHILQPQRKPHRKNEPYWHHPPDKLREQDPEYSQRDDTAYFQQKQ